MDIAEEVRELVRQVEADTAVSAQATRYVRQLGTQLERWSVNPACPRRARTSTIALLGDDSVDECEAVLGSTREATDARIDRGLRQALGVLRRRAVERAFPGVEAFGDLLAQALAADGVPPSARIELERTRREVDRWAMTDAFPAGVGRDLAALLRRDTWSSCPLERPGIEAAGHGERTFKTEHARGRALAALRGLALDQRLVDEDDLDDLPPGTDPRVLARARAMPSIRALDAVVHDLLRGLTEEKAEATRRHLAWVLQEMTLWVTGREVPEHATTSLAGILRRDSVTHYLDTASEGSLRTLAAAVPEQDYVNTTRARIKALGLIRARAVEAWGVDEKELGKIPTYPDPDQARPTPTPHQQNIADDRSQAIADSYPDNSSWVRGRALWRMLLATKGRSGELQAQTIWDLAPTLGWVRLVRAPQGPSPAAGTVELWPLSRDDQTAVRAWLGLRNILVAQLQGSSQALWVSVRANHVTGPDGISQPRRAGMPLMDKGLRLAYGEFARHINQTTEQQPGWEPIPRTMEQLRRSLDAEVPTTIEGLPITQPPPRPLPQQLIELVAAETRAYLNAQRRGEAIEERRRALRQAEVWAWHAGVRHAELFSALQAAGFNGLQLTDAGWEPALVRAVNLSLGWRLSA